MSPQAEDQTETERIEPPGPMPDLSPARRQQVLGQDMDVDITPYRLERFAEGKLLVGAYGIGSIS